MAYIQIMLPGTKTWKTITVQGQINFTNQMAASYADEISKQYKDIKVQTVFKDSPLHNFVVCTKCEKLRMQYATCSCVVQ